MGRSVFVMLRRCWLGRRRCGLRDGKREGRVRGLLPGLIVCLMSALRWRGCDLEHWRMRLVERVDSFETRACGAGERSRSSSLSLCVSMSMLQLGVAMVRSFFKWPGMIEMRKDNILQWSLITDVLVETKDHRGPSFAILNSAKQR
jgi:hypothetical protein